MKHILIPLILFVVDLLFLGSIDGFHVWEFVIVGIFNIVVTALCRKFLRGDKHHEN